MNIPKDSLMPEYGDGINALRYFTLTEPETDSGHSLVNHVQVPEHQQPIPQKHTRLSAGLDSGCSTPPEGSFDPQDASVDEEMSRLNTENFVELCSNELIDKQHDAYSAQEPENARRRQDEAKQSLQALRDGTEGDRESYTETLERIEILKETIKEFKQTIAKNTKVRRPLYAKLAILNILCCQNLDAIPTETLEVFYSSAIEVLKSVDGAMIHM
ncbi:unnamed protein product [Fusarium graminearum]|uniref:Chromosome 2, complete genome n=1 Tax=Gibberella zeae (strain ATCC MYA-4620 / CBS 123657 / FGSC 9075 / NRRL 31084 / PH-1) TaxID=229533 RepID=A0A098DHN0_GIBZE|nr:unnamed protein product [Fusarium graminearum]